MRLHWVRLTTGLASVAASCWMLTLDRAIWQIVILMTIVNLASIVEAIFSTYHRIRSEWSRYRLMKDVSEHCFPIVLQRVAWVQSMVPDIPLWLAIQMAQIQHLRLMKPFDVEEAKEGLPPEVSQLLFGHWKDFEVAEPPGTPTVFYKRNREFNCFMAPDESPASNPKQ